MEDIAHTMHGVMEANMWGVYLGIFLAPFVQEDAAVISAAGLAISGMGNESLVFATIVAGLTCSDIWKYWLGWAARSKGWAQKIAENKAVVNAKKLVRNKLVTSILTVRFIPGTRIPFYIASGYFSAPWLKFSFWIFASAVIYVFLIFSFFQTLGLIVGEQAKVLLPVVAICAVLGYLAFKRFRSGDHSPTAAKSE